ncbi:MAG: type II restriction endonuclease subunit M [Gammaproteobacteria bacterium]|nr:MAG: type II restriction endonuclease subunit M [Gammaproteobacteria bacterium]
MSTFLRLLSESDKAEALKAACNHLRHGEADPRSFEVAPASFDSVPSKPFAYWVSESVRRVFHQLPAFEGNGRNTKQGLATADDFRFVRVWWESHGPDWFGFAKGGAFSPIYADVYLLVNWSLDGGEIKNNLNDKGAVRSNVWMLRDTANNFFQRPGITWPRRTQGGLSLRAMPAGCIFADKGPAAFVFGDDSDELLALLALTNSRAFALLVSLQMAFGSYEVGVIQRTPVPTLTEAQRKQLASLARRAWSLKRTADSVNETSHAFVLPTALSAAAGGDRPLVIKTEIEEIHAAIDAIAFELYGFEEADREAINGPSTDVGETDADEDGEVEADVPSTDGLLSWAVGVAFGRFDLRIATGERALPPEPEPFDPLPSKSPGMLPEGTKAFFTHDGILVDEQGHSHDLVHVVEEVLSRVNAPVPDDLRRWLRKEFFAFHLKLYSKSRRKAPIYWPLATASGSYTLWMYYPSLSSQTLYKAINDFIEPKLKQVGRDLNVLRDKGANRSRDDERQFEALQAIELELMELRDTLLKLAPNYNPNHDDGVQISAAPLWPLFQHKPWQKVLKDTRGKLEKGDYDWAHLAMSYWPERVREKCKTDKSLAIAHGLEVLYVDPTLISGGTTK